MTERFAFGFTDWRGLHGTSDGVDLRDLSATIFPTEAKLRGWDMELFAKENPSGRWLSYGRIGDLIGI